MVSAGDPTNGMLPVFYIPTRDLAAGLALILATAFIAGILPAMQAQRLRVAPDGEEIDDTIETELVFLGMVGMIDPARPGHPSRGNCLGKKRPRPGGLLPPAPPGAS